MIYRYFITSPLRQSISSKKLGDEILQHLDKMLRSKIDLIRYSTLNDDFYIGKGCGAARFIWYKETRGNITVYVLRKVFTNHDEYTKEINEHKVGKWISQHLLSANEKIELDARFMIIEEQQKRKPLPQEYIKYEERIDFKKYQDVIIYEMPTWKEGMKKIEDTYLQSVIMNAIAEDMYKNSCEDEPFLFFTTDTGYTITYRYGETKSNGKADIFLMQIVKGHKPDVAKLREKGYDVNDFAKLKSYSNKCYPDYFTYEIKVWKDIEKDDEANLVLSDEEIAVLNNVQYPFFISGLAGSGKSTILYYLFANAYQYIVKRTNHKLLFLSYNDGLVEKAKEAVKAILSNNHNYNLGRDYFKDSEKDKLDNTKRFDDSFQNFRDFLISLLTEEEKSYFKDDKRINFDKFCSLYDTECYYGNHELSAPIVWSIIRTFIKGQGVEDFTSDDYCSKTLSKKDMTVDFETYCKAYKIYKTWYKGYYERGEHWDDLDLVRYIMHHSRTKSFHQYSVVFCDEAQDFTKIEIELILRFTVHSKYLLSEHPDAKKVPIAFAGDPNQTISPTGFRWAGTKKIFHDVFFDLLDDYAQLSAPELSINYRSDPGIVKFANTIQVIRYANFDDTAQSRSLQRTREDIRVEGVDALDYVGFYSYDKYKDLINNNLKEAIIITAGEDDRDKPENYPDAEKNLTDLDKELFTAIGSKGHEYNSVVIYLFSRDKSYLLFEKILKNEELNDSERFEAAHFFTKLYIAITRAKKQLFIVDTDESYERFWKYFTEHDFWEELIDTYNLDDAKRDYVGHVVHGDIEVLPTRLHETFKPAKYADEAFKKAINEESEKEMLSAKRYYLAAENEKDAKKCEAYVLSFQYKYEASGDKFIQIGNQEYISLAIEMYWKGKCWSKIKEYLKLTSNITAEDRLRREVAMYMKNETTSIEFVHILYTDIDAFQTMANDAKNRSIWSDVIHKTDNDLLLVDARSITRQLLDDLDGISIFLDWFDDGLVKLRASLYYKRAKKINGERTIEDNSFHPEDYEKAIKLWESKNLISNNDYYTAKKTLSSAHTDKIIWMDKLGETRKIIDTYGKTEYVEELSDQAKNIVFTRLLSSGIKSFRYAVAYPYPTNIENKWARLYAKDPAMFLMEVVLTDFTQEKFYFFAEKIHREESNIFETQRLSEELFTKIFRLTECDESLDSKPPYWVLFTSKLKNQYDERVFPRIVDKSTLLSSVNNLLISQIREHKDVDSSLAACFLELLFGDDYDYKRARQYSYLIASLFEDNRLIRRDFRIKRGRNSYFTKYTDINSAYLDKIKDNIRLFVKDFFRQIRSLSSRDSDEAKSMMRAFETCAKYNQHVVYDDIINFYVELTEKGKYSAISDWMKGRLYFIKGISNAYKTDNWSIEYFEQFLKNNDCSWDEIVVDLNIDDVAMLLAAIEQNSDSKKHLSKKHILQLTELIYNYRITPDEVRGYFRIQIEDRSDYNEESDKAVATVTEHEDAGKQFWNFILKIVQMLTKPLMETLSSPVKADDYYVQLMCYVWEAFFSHRNAAIEFDKLLKNRHIKLSNNQKNYFKRRALYHYMEYNEDLFIKKQNEYNLHITLEELEDYPNIQNIIIDIDSSSISQLPQPTDLATLKAIEKAKNMFTIGMSLETISLLTNLSISEIKNLDGFSESEKK